MFYYCEIDGINPSYYESTNINKYDDSHHVIINFNTIVLSNINSYQQIPY